MATTAQQVLRVVAFREGDVWVAQCLEYDIQAQGPDFATARRRLSAAINCEAEFTAKKNGTAFVGLDPAPAYFTEMFEAVDASLRSGDNVELRIAA